ncbi:MAG: translation initiation factor [Candidatus Aenigmarchaeota archaeon]|nr:translation initiation factor [Candidatus Aenigmarchaeota archaeon]
MIGDICPICGLPKELCTCKVIEREANKIKVYLTTRRFNKPTTIIEGIDEKSGKSISKQLKRKLACGGTYKEGRIELQGDHRAKIKDLLVKMGFEEEQIEVS